MTTMYSGLGDDNSDVRAVSDSLDSSGSLDALSDEFGSLRISAPTTYNTNATTLDTQQQRQFKQYQVNDHFANSAFISRLQEDSGELESSDSALLDSGNEQSVLEHNNNSILEHSDAPLADDSVLEYGTVQRPAKSGSGEAGQGAQFLPYMRHPQAQPQRGPSPNMHGLTFSYEGGDEPSDAGEYRANAPRALGREPPTREPPSALIIRDIGELSGQVLNTFKRKNEQRERGEGEGGAHSSPGNGESLEDPLSDDPALAAKEVYRNLLRSQGSLFNMKRPGVSRAGSTVASSGNGSLGHTRAVSNTVSTRGPSAASAPLNELNLITPGSIGYRFKHSKGLWVPDEEADAETETNTTTTMMMTTQGDSQYPDDSKGEEQNDREQGGAQSDREQGGAPERSGNESPLALAQEPGDTTTPLIAPRVDTAGVLNRARSAQSAREPRKDTEAASASASATATSAAPPLLSLLVARVPASQPDWARVHSVDLSDAGAAVTSLRGLAQYLPQLVELVARDTGIAALDGVPPTVRTLDLSGSAVGDALAALPEGNRVEQLCLARCRLRANLSVLAGAPSLRNADLRGNGIVSLGGLGSATVCALDLRDNALAGAVDLRRVAGANDNRLGGWLQLESLDLGGNALAQLTNVAALPALRTLRVGENKGALLVSASTDNNSTVSPTHSGVRTLDLTGSPGVTLDLAGFPQLETLAVHGDTCFTGGLLPPSLHTLEVRGGTPQGVAAVLALLPRDTRLETLRVCDIPQLQGLQHTQCARLTTLRELCVRDCGVSGAQALLAGLPYPNAIRALDIRGNPLLQRRMRTRRDNAADKDNRDLDGAAAAFKEQLEGVVRTACPFLQELAL
ncbi:Nud1 protein [Maudiozyma humilis]|uniref:Nud1 protein n=1 Tax=Maudiozyma humilis TaxID=51915 RepID=A0AAV5RX84_MAUHU|nr:Nud1 protein [Kazachstania humilis]